ncbi:MAG: PilZ domain-containing protein [Desulfuromonas sp.]|nr:PilZ domain-containing protein [Desulfuromonas sp.]
MPDTEISPTQPSADLRHNLRIALLIKKVKLEDNSRVFFGYATNISCGGFFISSVTPAPIGSRFTVEIKLPGVKKRPLCCKCETTWRRTLSDTSTEDPGMGLRFIDLDKDTQDTIDEWVQQQTGNNL